MLLSVVCHLVNGEHVALVELLCRTEQTADGNAALMRHFLKLAPASDECPAR